MKIAISGKGGTGKTTIAAALCLLLAKRGKKVLALDADPDSNFASALGIPQEEQKKIIPISEQKALIEERTGAKIKEYGQMFKLNPHVSDIAEKYAYNYKGIALLVLGAIESGGSGCACPENVLIRALVQDLILHKDEILIMDMEAGIEHLGRATAKGVDVMVVIVEPGQRSIESAYRVIRMSNDIGLFNIKFIANKVTCKDDKNYIKKMLPAKDILEFIPFSLQLIKLDRAGKSVLDDLDETLKEKFLNILNKIENNR